MAATSSPPLELKAPTPGKLLFCSQHCYLDPSSGAAIATRQLFELLAERGWRCEVLCGPRMDFEEEPSLPRTLNDHGIPYRVLYATDGPVPFVVFKCRPEGVPVTVFQAPPVRHYFPALSPPRREPTREEGCAFLALVERQLAQAPPDAMLTFGGDWLAREIMASAKRHRVPVVFALHNFSYHDRSLFEPVDRVLVPAHFAREHYARTLGLNCIAIPGPWKWSEIQCREWDGKYVTFVNPQPHKGVFLFARLVHEMWRRRPDIPFLIVEGRANASWLGRTGLDLQELKNLFVMANTPDPRDFYRQSRMVLMPSLWSESFARVATEALINGIPVLGARRGGLPETLAKAGILFDVPEKYTSETRLVPTPEEIAPWVETIIRLWDDAAFYDQERRRCLAAAEAWRPERLLPRFEELFGEFSTAPRNSGT